MCFKRQYDLGLRTARKKRADLEGGNYASKGTKTMRKVIACEFMTLDGVIQNEENDGDGFKHGGWFFGYADEATGSVVQERLAKPVDLLLGRKTFAGWETYWPTHSNFWPN